MSNTTGLSVQWAKQLVCQCI